MFMVLDTIELWNGNFSVPLLRTGLAWPLEKALFRNPPGELLNESTLHKKYYNWILFNADMINRFCGLC